MKRIDDPIDAAMSQLEDDSESTPLEIVKKLATAVPLLAPLACVDALEEHFSNRKRFKRVYECFSIFKAEHDSLQSELAQEKKALAKIDSYLKSPKFAEAVVTAAEESVRTANEEKIKRFGRVLANGPDPRIEASDDDLSSFIRDLSQLSEIDLKSLEIIVSTAGLTSIDSYVVNETDGLLGQHLAKAAAEQRLLQDDFYSHAFRLVGFGLALEVPRDTVRQMANDFRFLPTRRGRHLLALLKHRT